MHYINLLLTLTCLGASAEQLQGRSQTYLHWPVTDWTTATTGANTAIPPPGGGKAGQCQGALESRAGWSKSGDTACASRFDLRPSGQRQI